MMKQTLLAVFAHPDDEAFSTGGSLAHYAAQGTRVALVCATRGEAGEIADERLATPETLGDVRENELRCAARALGITELIFLGYRDSGMAGTPENDDPRALANIPAEEVVPRLVGVMRRVRPDVVVTFEPGGGYGHPDHVAVHRHTIAAFHAAADAARYPEQGQPWQAARLFYAVIPRSFFVKLREWLEAAGVNASELARFEEPGMGWPDDRVHVRVDVADKIEAKWAALLCHRTQFGSNHLFRRTPEDELKAMMSVEHFALAWPNPEPGLRLADLFAGLDHWAQEHAWETASENPGDEE